MIRLTAIVASGLLTMLAPSSQAQSFVCGTASTGADYCSYTGKIRKVLMNEDNLLLVFFESGVDISQLPATGTFGSVRTGSAVAFNIDKNPEFAKAMFDAAMTASIEGHRMNFEMDGGLGRYMKASLFAFIPGD